MKDLLFIMGCPTCKTSGGITCCSTHGQKQYSISTLPTTYCPKHNCPLTCDECDAQTVKGMTSIIYNSF